MIKIAFYGKGGIGKSTTVTNIAIALAEKGYKVLQVGCDPKADSTRFLQAGEYRNTDKSSDINNIKDISDPSAVSSMIHSLREGGTRTVMDFIRARKPFMPQDIVKTGFSGILCAEAGGPLPGQGCAGRAVITALEKMEEIGVYDTFRPDIVLYDVLGDVVCGGFAMPMRKGYADYVYILTSGETMSLYAAANIGLALEHFKDRGYAKTGGIILNRRDVPEEDGKTEALARELGTQVVGTLSHSETVLKAEQQGKSVLQAFPESEMAQEYRRLAGTLEENVEKNHRRSRI